MTVKRWCVNELSWPQMIRSDAIRQLAVSFAATLALVAGYERGMPWARAGADFSPVGRRFCGGDNVSSCLRFALFYYCALRRLPLPSRGSLWRAVQFAGDAGGLRLGDADGHSRRARHSVRLRCRVLAADGVRHRMDGSRSRCGSHLPGAFGRVPSSAPGRFACDRGLVLVCLLKTPLCWSGALFCRAGDYRRGARRRGRTYWSRQTGASRCAAPTADCVSSYGGDTFAIKEWLAADAEAAMPGSGLGAGHCCDPSGCIGKLPDGRLVSYALTPEAFEDDCRRAAVSS